ncbi:hypothetical protein NF867_03185 [Solitalea sp. MAHUQ-68]|uniref:DUF4382 domain-containing protein n=1 Tax=Solitalea agri TaxID=2953739 RepID=A0A9X2JBB9_9SPHI|nr:hypothetical protein [Solitalea agri]MCO4291863.1 hypothetical protein [Solitalea agri]
MKTKLSFLALITLALISCKKEEDKASSFSYQIKASNTANSLTSSSTKEVNSATKAVNGAPTINFTAGSLLVSEVNFNAEKDEPEGQNEDNTEMDFEFKGPIQVDLFGASQSFGNVKVIAGAYEDIYVSIKAKNLALSGTYGTTPVEILANGEVEFEGQYGKFLVNEDIDYLGLIHMNLGLLTANISTTELDNATKTNGKIVISSTSNQAIYAKMLANLAALAEVNFENED